MLKLIALCLLLYASFADSVGPYLRCQRNEQNTHGCCSGYRWDVSKEDCIKCNPGYTGIECAFVCPYPLYGDECQQICKCSEWNCDVASGCLNNRKKNYTILFTYARHFDQIYSERSTPEKYINWSTEVVTQISIKDYSEENLEKRILTNWNLLLSILVILSVLIFAYLGKYIYQRLSTRTASIKRSDVESVVDTKNVDQDKSSFELAYESIEDLTHCDAHGVLASIYDRVQDTNANIELQVHNRQEDDVLHMHEIIQMEDVDSNMSENEQAGRGHAVYEKTMPSVRDQPDDLYISVIA